MTLTGVRLGAVHLTVTRLERALDFYRAVLGLRVHRRDDGSVALGAGGDDLLVLHEQTDARPPGRHAGLYHYALLFSSREELARAAARLGVTRTPIQGASDHITHEAIYLADPDGNGIELAADRPRDAWPDFSVVYGAGPQRLDLDGLLETIAGEAPHEDADGGLRMGHVHLHGASTDAALGFYRDAIGFELMADLSPQAVFLAADGYHHHVAVNTWRGVGVGPQPPDTVGLRHWTVRLEEPDAVAAVRERARAAGAPVTELLDGTVAVRDPGELEVHFTTA